MTIVFGLLYEAYAAARPKVVIEPDISVEEATRIYGEFCRTGHFPVSKPRKQSKAELEWAKEWANLTLEEAGAAHEAFRKERDRG